MVISIWPPQPQPGVDKITNLCYNIEFNGNNDSKYNKQL